MSLYRSLDYDKFFYAKTRPKQIKFLTILKLVTYLGVIYSFFGFISLSPWYAILFGPVLFITSLYFVIGNFLVLFYPGFSQEKHEELRDEFWKKHSGYKPSVDVFLPVCGEDMAIFERTMLAVKKLNYDNYRVYVLDDKNDPLFRRAAWNFGFDYLSRPNKPWMKKAGNLQFGYQNSHGEFVLVLDADFIPHPDFLLEALPYTTDPKVGIVQTAQFFDTSNETYHTSPLAGGGGRAVENFYKVINTSRDVFKAAICVGTNAIYRRSAIEAAGGNALSEHAEDVMTGLHITKAGFCVKYIPIILAIGLCPDDLQSYFNQHNRWCSGSTIINKLESKEQINKNWPTKLTIMQRLCYAMGGLYYLRGALSMLMSAQIFLLLLFHSSTIRLHYTLWYVPFILAMYILPNLFESKLPRLGDLYGGIVKIYIYLFTILGNLIGKRAGWVATGIKKTKLSSDFEAFINFTTFINVILFGATGLVISRGLLFAQSGLIIPSIIILYLLFVHGAFAIWANWVRSQLHTAENYLLVLVHRIWFVVLCIGIISSLVAGATMGTNPRIAQVITSLRGVIVYANN